MQIKKMFDGIASASRWLALVIVAAFLLLGCRTAQPALQRFVFAELHMGSMFRIVLYAPDQLAADHAAEMAFWRVAELDDMMTDYDPNSELMQFSQRPSGTPVKASQELFAILEQSQIIAQKSGGAFDVTVGPCVQLWRSARKIRKLPGADQVTEVRRATGYEKMRLDARQRTVILTVPGMRLDLGGIAKGYAADQALATLRRLGIKRAMVAASGDIAVGDPPPNRAGWSIGIQSIDQSRDNLTQEVLIHNAGISTSGDTEQYVEIDGRRYSHIVDPKTGLGLTERIGVTIIAPNGTTSDGLSTAVSVMGAEKGMALVEAWPGVSALIIKLTPDGKQVIESRRFKHVVKIGASGAN